MVASSSAVKTVGELAAHVGGQAEGDLGRQVLGVNGLADAQANELAFYSNPRYRRALEQTAAAAVVVGPDATVRTPASLIRVKNPHLAFARISALFHPRPRPPSGISDRAQVHPEARVDPTATVMGLCTVERGATVGARTILYPGSYVGENASIGSDCVLYPQATVLEGCQVGNRVILHASAVLGADGFGYAFDPEGPAHYKVPQVGTVRVEDDVEIGASSCVDRATLGETVIGRGSKLDNLVQVGHNVKVGPLVILCGQVGIAGSTELGAGVVMAGQSGAVNHIKIAPRTQVGAQSAVMRDHEGGGALSGTPAIPHSEWLKSSAAFGGLSELTKEVRRLRQRIEALEKQEHDGSA